MRSPGIEPLAGVVQADAAADLQPARIGGHSAAGWLLITRTEHNDMSALQPISFVELGKPGSRPVRNKVGAQSSGLILERAAHDLFDLPFVKVDARTKH